MEQAQATHVQAIGEKFIVWYNASNGTAFVFSHREDQDQSPDLTFTDGAHVLRVEVVGAYYNKASALHQRQSARLVLNAPTRCQDGNFDEALIKNVERRIRERCSERHIREKCRMTYGPDCVLLVSVRPGFTTVEEMERPLSRLALPTSVPFAGVYVAGEFATSPRSKGGYHVWQLGVSRGYRLA